MDNVLLPLFGSDEPFVVTAENNRGTQGYWANFYAVRQNGKWLIKLTATITCPADDGSKTVFEMHDQVEFQHLPTQEQFIDECQLMFFAVPKPEWRNALLPFMPFVSTARAEETVKASDINLIEDKWQRAKKNVLTKPLNIKCGYVWTECQLDYFEIGDRIKVVGPPSYDGTFIAAINDTKFIMVNQPATVAFLNNSAPFIVVDVTKATTLFKQETW